MSKQRVFVGMSGGVDSSVAALRLKTAGYDVVGVFIKVWHPDFMVCNWEQERLDAMRVAAQLEIPFLTCDAEAAYKQHVADYFISEYRAGRTPNPDVMCNKAVKFGAFLEFARARGVELIATGHYARRAGVDSYQLRRGVDTDKDQSYFLWTLTQAQLQHVLLPVGDSPKSQIRAEADTAGLITATKKDSQGICFLGHVDIPDFLSHFIDLHTGAVLNEAGEVIGEHRGALVYTIGQRHGFTLTSANTERHAHYVVARDLAANTITVSPTPPQRSTQTIMIHSCNWITEIPHSEAALSAQARYRQTPFAVTIEHCDEASCTLRAPTNTEAYAPGQSLVVYDGDNCLGGGIIG